MSAREHERAVNAALEAGERVGRGFERIGTTSAPNGVVVRLYRQLIRSIAGELAAGRPRGALAAMRDARALLSSAVLDILTDSAEGGATQAEAEAGIYTLSDPAFDPAALPAIVEARDAILAVYDMQINAARVELAVSQPDVRMLIGDTTRTGIVSPIPVAREASRFVATIAGAAYTETITASLDRAGVAGDEFLRQAVAAIDERTTDCCLRVNGQTTTLDGAFLTPGTPHYAERQKYVPFHWYCRSSISLVRVGDAEDALTRSMRDAGRAELRAREDGSRKVIHPADSRSRRT